MSRKPTGSRTPPERQKEYDAFDGAMASMVTLAGGVEKAASRITDEPLKLPRIPVSKFEGWKRKKEKGCTERPEGKTFRTVCRLPKGCKGGGKFAKPFTKEEVVSLYGLDTKKGREY